MMYSKNRIYVPTALSEREALHMSNDELKKIITQLLGKTSEEDNGFLIKICTLLENHLKRKRGH